jgi:hypothetical protein
LIRDSFSLHSRTQETAPSQIFAFTCSNFYRKQDNDGAVPAWIDRLREDCQLP